jgi:hypothetical protein
MVLRPEAHWRRHSAFCLLPVWTVAQVLVSLGIEPAYAGYFEDVLRTGCTLVTVQSENGIVDALKILERRGAVARLEDCK